LFHNAQTMRRDTPDSEQPAYDYDAIYREYAPRVRALARRRLNGRDVSEDVVQEVFMRAFRALPTLDLGQPLWPWLHRVCVNVCIDVLKSPRTWAEEPAGELPERIADAEVDPVARVVADEQRQAIVDALDTLAPRQREILLRRVLEGATSEDMAAEEGSSIDAVKSAVKRGRQMFRRAYTDIAGDRGLLGGTPPTPALPDRLRAALGRLRGAYDACLRVCNAPGWQAVPVALSAAVLAFGWSAGPAGRDAAGASAGPWGRDEYRQGRMAIAAVSGLARSSSGATRPGGGAPPSPPPGHNRGSDGPQPKPVTRGRVGAGIEDSGEDSTLYVRWKHDNQANELLGLKDDNRTWFSSNMGCNSGEVRRAACPVIKQAMPSVTKDYAYWGP